MVSRTQLSTLRPLWYHLCPILLSMLFFIAFLTVAQGAPHPDEPEIPVYEPPRAAKSSESPQPPPATDSLPSPISPINKGPTKNSASKISDQPSIPKKAPQAAPPSNGNDTTESQDSKPDTAQALPTQPSSRYASKLILEGGDAQASKVTLSNIRYSGKATNGRLVFDFSSANSPWCHVHFSSSTKTTGALSIECEGINGISLPRDWMSKLKKTSLVAHAKGPNVFEEGQLLLNWKIAKNTEAKVFQLSKPGRLVIDLTQSSKTPKASKKP